MKFSHTFWMGPVLDERWALNKEKQLIGNLYYYTLSFAYLKNLKQEVYLYTDCLGYKLLDHIPYDYISKCLDQIPSDSCPCMWAQGKMFGLKEASLDEIFIDGDVFIKDTICLDKISEHSKYDAFFQGKEFSEHMYLNLDEKHLSYEQKMCKEYIYWDHNIRLDLYKFPFNIPFMGKYAYNGGIVVFNNAEYKNKFLEAYFCMYDQIQKCDITKREYIRDRNFCPDLICEQRFLYELGKDYNVGFLLNYDEIDDDGYQTIYQQANEIKYQHVIGPYKFDQIDICKEVLKKVNFDLYLQCERKEKDILDGIFM